MKICPHCQSPVSDNAKFCIRCGCSLQKESSILAETGNDKSKNRNKVIAGILAAILVISLAGAGVFIVTRSKPESYTQVLASANRYYAKQDYKRAEEFYLKAIELEPKIKESYIQLFEIYTLTGQTENAKEILISARNNLSEDHYLEVQAETIETKNLQQDLTDTEDINEPDLLAEHAIHDTSIETMDMTPINYLDQGWIVKVNGKYGFYTPEGEWLTKPEFDRMYYIIEEQSLFLRKETGYSDSNSVSGSDLFELGSFSFEDYYQLAGAAGGGIELVIDENGNVMERPMGINSKGEMGGLDEVSQYVLDQKDNHIIGGDYGYADDGTYGPAYYHIWLSATDQLFGPYDASQQAVITWQTHTNTSDDHMDIIPSPGKYNRACGIFYAYEEDGSMTLYSQDASCSLTGFDKIEILSDTAALCWKGEQAQMVVFEDNELKVQFVSSSLEAASPAIQNRALVKFDGTWKLMPIDKLQPADSVTEPETDKDKKDKELPVEAKANPEDSTQSSAL